jgi:leucine dehydrogenase
MDPERILRWHDPESGLRAIVVIDNTTLGPAAGGIRTRRYASDEAAEADVRKLARAMTIKCALGGLDAGGGKAVVIEHDSMDRSLAFAELGKRVEALGGVFRTAGDLGTTAVDLTAMATHCQYVHTNEGALVDAVGRGLVRCASACAERTGRAVAGLRVAVQGCGAIGEAVARHLVGAGAEVTVADIDRKLAERVAEALSAAVCEPEHVLGLDVDMVAPCAIGGVIDDDIARSLSAWAVCGAANNIFASDTAARLLHDRNVLVVPDVIASAGAVVDGVGATVMGLPDRSRLVDALGDTAARVLEQSAQSGRPTGEVAVGLAWQRIAAAS